MFLRLLSIETTRLTRRALPWVALAACALYIGASMQNHYANFQADLLNAGQKMPGFSFDLATSLDQAMFILLPFLVLIAANMIGNDYTQRTNQHWLMRAPRHTGLLAKFFILVGFTFVIQVLTLLVGGSVGWYYKTYVFGAFSLANVNALAVLAAPFYLTLAAMPYLALILLFTVIARSTLTGAIIGLGVTQFIDILVTSFLFGRPWMMWHPHNLYVSVTYLLNRIGNKVVAPPEYLAQPQAALIALLVYTLVFLAAAVWLYRRQDVGG